MDLAARIAQFENMAKADPSNEMAHFSLGGAYVQAGRHADAAKAYMDCFGAAPEMSKALQLAAECLSKAGDPTRAIEVARQGYEVAATRGDLMPKQAIARLLQSLGQPVPEVANEDKTAEALAASGAFMCAKTGRPGRQMDRPPFKGAVGEWIRANISEQTWQEWIRQGTKVINELRLDLSRDQDAETYDRYMREYLGIDDALLAELTGSAARG
ncbi:MAG: Fe(2+)-trafficking protein [Planctomycetes bacterium]|nr:Fe(2+)-trafficking protein [Planctomycetota bacterium]